MKYFGRNALSVLAGVAASSMTASSADAQFVAVNNYQAPQPRVVQAPPAYQVPNQAPGYQTPGYQAPAAYATYPHVAQAGPRVAQAGDLPAPAEALGSGTRSAVQAEPPVTPVVPAPVYSAPAPAVTQGVPVHVTPAPVASAPVIHHEVAPQASYAAPVGSAGCATGDCGTAPVTHTGGIVDYTYAPVGVGYDNYGGAACDLGRPVRPRRQWFGGIYGLLLERNTPSRRATAVFVQDLNAVPGGAPSAANPYYIPADIPTLSSTNAETDVAWGGEIRFGSTFGSDPCSCTPRFAWEVAYWGLDEDESQATLLLPGVVGGANTSRIYGRIDYTGIEFDRTGVGAYRPLNDYTDFQDPITNDGPEDVRVLGQRVRQSFNAQNIELNFWRFGTPATAGGGGIGSFGRGRLSGTCGGNACGPCGAGSCHVGPARPPRRFFINGLAGIRFFRTDETFQNALQFAVVDGAGDPLTGEPTQYIGVATDDANSIFHDVDVDNQLVGFQLGCSMNWLVGCKWNLFADSNFGVYNNQIDVTQNVYGGGTARTRLASDQSAASISSSTDRAAFLGDFRFGFGYQVSSNCRLTAAYRVLALSGVALATDQIGAFTNRSIASYVNDNGSLVLHGLQSGVEFKY